MTNLIADLKNDNNWRQAYQDERSVVFDDAGGYTPLPAFEVPITFDTQLLAVRTLSNNAKFTWRFSGVLSHLFELGDVISPLPTASHSYHRLRINRSNLIYFPNFGTDYQLIFEPYWWIKHINLTIWEYTGEITSAAEKLVAEVRDTDLSRIESKVDDISTYGN